MHGVQANDGRHLHACDGGLLCWRLPARKRGRLPRTWPAAVYTSLSFCSAARHCADVGDDWPARAWPAMGEFKNDPTPLAANCCAFPTSISNTELATSTSLISICVMAAIFCAVDIDATIWSTLANCAPATHAARQQQLKGATVADSGAAQVRATPCKQPTHQQPAPARRAAQRRASCLPTL